MKTESVTIERAKASVAESVKHVANARLLRADALAIKVHAQEVRGVRRLQGGSGGGDIDPEALLVFLEMFDGMRLICAPCLARLADERTIPVRDWLDGRVAQGSVRRASGSCLNCNELLTVYSLPRLA